MGRRAARRATGGAAEGQGTAIARADREGSPRDDFEGRVRAGVGRVRAGDTRETRLGEGETRAKPDSAKAKPGRNPEVEILTRANPLCPKTNPLCPKMGPFVPQFEPVGTKHQFEFHTNFTLVRCESGTCRVHR